MNPIEYGQWYYVIYLVPGGAALLTLMLSVMGGQHRVGHSSGHHIGAHHGSSLTAHSGHGQASCGHQPAGHAGHTVGSNTHAHISDHPIANSNHTSPRHNHSPAERAAERVREMAVQTHASLGDQMLGLIGFGRVPAPFVWGSLLLGWSIFGFWATRMLQDSMRHPALFVLPAMAIAVAGAIGMARMISAAMPRFMPADESAVRSSVELCGLTGRTAFRVDETRGRVHVYDDFGTMHDCSARIEPGRAAIDRGKTVLVVDYDAAHDQLVVEEAS